MKKLISLEEYSEKIKAEIQSDEDEFIKKHLNGIACPKCGKELYDSQPNVIYGSGVKTSCSNDNCDYEGYRSVNWRRLK